MWLENKQQWSRFRKCPDCRIRTAQQARRETDTRTLPFVPHRGRDGKGGQNLIIESKKQNILVVAGAGWGKDVGCVGAFSIWFAEMLMEEYRDHMLLDPRVHAWIIAPTVGLTDQNWRYFWRFFPNDWIVDRDENERKIYTIYDGLIEFKSTTNPNTLVSVGLDLLLWTEIAQSEQQDKLELAWANLYSRLHRHGRGPKGQGGRFLGNSTPNGRGLFHKMYVEALKNPKEWDILHFTSWDSPYVKEEDMERARRTLPERLFKQIWLAEFVDEGGAVFSNIETVCKGEEQKPSPERRYFAAWDPASPRGEDYSVLSIRDDLGNQVLLRAWTGKQWTEQRAIVAALCREYRAPLKILKTGVGETLPESMAQMGLNVTAIHETNELKAGWVTHFAVLCEQAAITLINDPFLKHEMESFQAQLLSSGQIRYSAPKGEHDDRVMATIACYSDFKTPGEHVPFFGRFLGAKQKVKP